MKQATRIRHTPDRVGIYRIPDQATGAQVLHVYLSRNGQQYTKGFVERRCGGPQQALQLAQAWRDNIVATHPPMSLAHFCAIVRSNNTSGVPGVARTRKHSKSRAGRLSTIEYWTARIPSGEGRTRPKNFSIARYGEAKAKQLAIDERLRGLAALEDIVFRAELQPQQVSSEADMLALEALLNAPSERKAQQVAQREQRAKKTEEKATRAAERRSRAVSEQERALAAPSSRGSEPYISRYSSAPGAHGYWRVSIVRDRHKHRKTFSDRKHGGEAPALAAAKIWRDQVFLAHPLAAVAVVSARINTTNTSGVSGVFIARHSASGLPESWVARSPARKGQATRSKRFSIAKYGNEGAYALAVQAREAFLAATAKEPSLHHRAAKKIQRDLAVQVQFVVTTAFVPTTD